MALLEIGTHLSETIKEALEEMGYGAIHTDKAGNLNSPAFSKKGEIGIANRLDKANEELKEHLEDKYSETFKLESITKKTKNVSSNINKALYKSNAFNSLREITSDLSFKVNDFVKNMRSTGSHVLGGTGKLRLQKLYKQIGKSETRKEIAKHLVSFAKEKVNSKEIKNLQLVECLVKGSGDYEPISCSEDFNSSLENAVFNLENLETGEYGNWISAREIFERIKDFTTPVFNLFQDYSILGGLLGKTAFESFDNMDCLIGLVPIRHATEIEVAHSGRVLKFRATGSVFLAHQEGGKDAIRVEGYFYKNEVLYGLLGLWITFLYCNGDVKEIDETDTSDYELGSKGLKELRSKMSSAKAYRSDLKKPTYVNYRTIPFVSQHVIIPNAYIETFSFEDRIVDGMNVLKYSILLRTYETPEDIQIYSHDDTNINFYADKGKVKSKFNMVSTFVINAIRRFKQAENIYFKKRYYQKSIIHAEDTYYNIDYIDMASTFSMGVIAGAMTGKFSDILG